MANDSSMKNDHNYAEMLNMMREQGKKDNPVTLQLGVMQSANSVKIDDLILRSEDLYIADYLISGYTRVLKVPYVSKVTLDVQKEEYVTDVTVNTQTQEKPVFTDGLKAGDLVAVQKLQNTNKYVILARVKGA